MINLHSFDRVVDGNVHLNVGVQIFELIERCFCASDFSDVFRMSVEISAQFFSGDFSGIIDCDLFGTGED